MAQRAEELPPPVSAISPLRSIDSLPPPTIAIASYLRRMLDRMSNLASERRMFAELVEFQESSVYEGVGLPRGNGEGVILVEGYWGPELYLEPMAHTLDKVGFTPIHSGIRLNLGLVRRHSRRVEDTIVEAAEKYGEVKIVTHSLGGPIAKVAVQKHPDKVKSFVTIASPHNGLVHRLIGLLYNRADRELLHRPLPNHIGQTNIIVQDGVIGRRASISSDPRVAQIEAEGSHGGAAWNKNAVINTVHALAA